jgi:hypothetical protein
LAPGGARKKEMDGRPAARKEEEGWSPGGATKRNWEDEFALMEHHLRMEELGEKMTSSRNCELTMMLSTSIESEQEDTEKRHDECFLGQIFGFLRSKYLGERQPLASIAEKESTWKI